MIIFNTKVYGTPHSEIYVPFEQKLGRFQEHARFIVSVMRVFMLLFGNGFKCIIHHHKTQTIFTKSKIKLRIFTESVVQGIALSTLKHCISIIYAKT